MTDEELIRLVHAAEFGDAALIDLDEILVEYEPLPAWVAKAFRCVLDSEESSILYLHNEDCGSFLVDMQIECGWDYVDDGEWAKASFSKPGMEIYVSREDILESGKSGCRAWIRRMKS